MSILISRALAAIVGALCAGKEDRGYGALMGAIGGLWGWIISAFVCRSDSPNKDRNKVIWFVIVVVIGLLSAIGTYRMMSSYRYRW